MLITFGCLKIISANWTSPEIRKQQLELDMKQQTGSK